ncbi:MAG: bacillithiol biosynthesis deacetylase BshB1 [Planctomycetes bacterium]|nr:bacillithiol biosynthesis deacetylase BshB1 [Planctomycetota bacterium]
MPEPIDLLAIGPHPDDAEMSSGGWLALASKQGYRTGIIHLTKGEMGTHGTAQQRVKEARDAGRILGLSALEFAGLIDGHVNDDEKSVAVLVRLIRRLRPGVLIAPPTVCHHPDHEAAGRLAIKAVHFAALKKYSAGRGDGGVHKVKRIVHARYSVPFDPSFYVDVSSVIGTKLTAIAAYAGQFVTSLEKTGEPKTRMSRPGFLDQFISVTASYGLKAGCAHAEAYYARVAPTLKDPIKTLNEGPSHHLIR